MKNRILHLTRNTIPYVKELHVIAGGVLGCLVMQQLDYWFENHPEGFYKFLEPSDHPAYKIGDSWTEELGMSRHEFRTAFDKIGIRYKSKSDFDRADDKFQGLFYCSYVDRRSNLTYYFRNHDLVDAALDQLLSKPPTAPSTTWAKPAEKPHLASEHPVKPDSGFTGNQESVFTGKPECGFTGNQGCESTVNPDIPPPLYRDYNTETTTTTDNSGAIDPGGCGENLIFPKCTENESVAIHQLLSSCPDEMQQAALDEIEGARQAGVIKTNLVPFARGIMMAIARGTFTVGHGSKVLEQRNRQNRRMTSDSSNKTNQLLDTNALSKGKALLEKVNGLRTKIS
ncbi:hypothetical protein [Fluviibacter phosphoraccumulans]|nr:hypothetical protein [Fluviibacter phosphoraccumulans]